MVSLHEACQLAYKRRAEFETFRDLGIDRAFDCQSHWGITFAYLDKESQYTPLGTIDMIKPKYFYINKCNGEFVSDSRTLFEVEKNPCWEIPVPDVYYRVPWYEYGE